MVVWHILAVHACFLLCTHHIDMTSHIPAFFFLLCWVPLVYMSSTAQLGIVSYHTFGALPVGQSPIHVLSGLMIKASFKLIWPIAPNWASCLRGPHTRAYGLLLFGWDRHTTQSIKHQSSAFLGYRAPLTVSNWAPHFLVPALLMIA